MDWTQLTWVFGSVGPTVVALAVIFTSGKDRLAGSADKLAEKVNDLAERVSRVEDILIKDKA